MAEENQVTKELQQVTKEPQQVTTKEPQQVTTKNPKKAEAGKHLAAHNRRRREEKNREEQVQSEKSEVNQYYGLGVVLAVGVIGGLGYYIYQSKEGEASGEQPSNPQQNNPKPRPQSNKFEMD